MKKMFKLMAAAVAIVLAAGSFAGCGKEDVSVSTNEKYTYWSMLDVATVGQTMESLGEHAFYKAVSEATGINMEFIHPARGSSGSEAFQILLASNDMPDIVAYSWGGTGYPGGPDKAIEDGVIIALNDYLEEYAPNYYEYMEGEKGKEKDYAFKRTALSDKGNYYGFRTVNIGSYGCFDGLYVRKDLLDKWGMDIPVTVDDWENVFKKAKEEGFKYPLTGRKNILDPFSAKDLYNTAWGVSHTFYTEDGKVKFGPYEPGYKEYLAKMAQWMKAGYIDPDYVTNETINTDAYIMNETSMATVGFIGSGLGKLLPVIHEKQPDWVIAACPMPVMKEGDIPKFQTILNPTADGTMAITVACGAEDEKRYLDAIKWCDYIYSEEGKILKLFGVEGDTYTIQTGEDGEGHYIYTDKVVKDFADIGAQDLYGGIYHYALPSLHPGFCDHNDCYAGTYIYDEQKDALNVWNKYIDTATKYVLPKLSYTTEEAEKIAVIAANGNDNFAAAVSNIVLGKQSIDTYDDAVNALKEAGYDEYIEIQQAAYDRYLAK